MFARREGGLGPADGAERGRGRPLGAGHWPAAWKADGVGTRGRRRGRPRGAFAVKHTVRLALVY